MKKFVFKKPEAKEIKSDEIISEEVKPEEAKSEKKKSEEKKPEEAKTKDPDKKKFHLKKIDVKKWKAKFKKPEFKKPSFNRWKTEEKEQLKAYKWRGFSYYRHMSRQQAGELANRYSLLLHVIACLVGYFVIEALSRHSVGETWEYLFDRSWVFLYNSFLIFLTTLPVYLLRRRWFYRFFITSFWLLLGIINSIMLAKRVTPFTGPDVKNLSEGLGVISKYMTSFQTGLMIAGLVALVLILVIVFIKAPKFKGYVHHISSLIMLLVVSALFSLATRVALDNRLLSNYFGNIAFAYQDYGYPYCLSVTLFDTGISSPSGYSESLVKHIVKDSGNEENTDSEDMPNVIFVQLESFFDPTNVRYLNLSEDPIPFFRSLEKEYSSGFYTVPSVGAGTANTEFETLTGMSMRYFGPGEYPYKSVLKEKATESAATVFDSLGYTSHAVHNNVATFYSRKTVFANLGFDTFTSEEFMPEQADVTPLGWMKDEVLTSKIVDCLDSTAGSDFVFTVSVQGHGAYPTEPTYPNPQITVSGAETDELNCEWEYYVNEIHEMDQFIEQLVNTLSEKEEKYVLVLYGDHLPTMGLEERDLKNGDLFQTEYVIWDNFGLKEKNQNLSAYQIMSEVMNQIGVHDGTIFRFHQTQQDSELYQIDLETLQYDMLYGEEYVYDGESPYTKKHLQMGIKDAKVEEVEKITDSVYYVKGENFTPSTVVLKNEEEIESTYINTTTILIQGSDFEDGDWVGIATKSNSSSGKLLKKGNIIVYHPPKIEVDTEETPDPENTQTPASDMSDGTVIIQGTESDLNTDTSESDEKQTTTDPADTPENTGDSAEDVN